MVLLREAVTVVVRDLPGTHRELTGLGAELGLPMPDEDSGSKRERLEACLRALTDDDLLPVAQRLLISARVQVRGPARYGLEDAVWSAGPVIEIPGRVRRELAAALDLGDLVHRHERFERLLKQFWIIDHDPLTTLFGSSTPSLRALIRQHFFRNPEDWSVEKLFEELGAFEATSARFGRFLAGLVDPAILPDTAAQHRIVAAINPVLAGTGSRLEETGERDGYPFFELVRTGPGAPRRLKTLVFATTAKPDMRMVSVLDNDIEILDNGDDTHLVYDRPIGPGGLRWSDLLNWWQETRGTGDEVKDRKALYDRLLDSMPKDGDSPQRAFCRAYYEAFASRAWDVPALLPEVWLHWDHKTVKQRGVRALLNHRMDFLLLLPNGARVIVEVDGPQHYATTKAVDDTVRGDRDLRLRGYDLWRVTTSELSRQPLSSFVG
ncbi:AbiJ-related protein, partial [Kitasatospora griseola]|uniref:AbiJ-related protein n=1 Tax=Kitasatospora griseola TaxID=2064 RepID=UPI0016710BCE